MGEVDEIADNDSEHDKFLDAAITIRLMEHSYILAIHQKSS